ncbi:glycolate oxidase FAD binding subunit [Nocardioides luteus]|uniref:Glycolate oxidase n=1 Tax=Nocardioides luteus TaxID=1844 RepID=A0ABQ5T0B1_9ACTN|nr:FAD-binding oxidoreductase [Nocardioides luteus]MDR7310343.1 glycolate oxidase FAD binding subunit [Nocardioides luteus]GGR53308.1 glycolate oxidase [Nocardioides luteus]GLJ69877.1 glycolate oxidase [Nocardioides luteus]
MSESLAGRAASEASVARPTWSVAGVRPGRTERPTNTAEVAQIMRDAAAAGESVIPTGAGTKLDWGNPPTSADVLLDLSALDGVREHAAGDLIATVGAGTPLSRLKEHVATAGQRLALDETIAGATVGGTLAANTSGPLRMLAGTMRDLLIGVTIVRADGVVAKAGGKVVKNVAGYDVGKLLVGSMGTLAVVTEATFRLHPVPQTRRWVTVAARDASHAAELARAVLHSQTVPAALEVDATGDGIEVAVLVEGRPEGVAGRTAVLSGLLPGATVDEEPPESWGRYPWADMSSTHLGIKVTFRLSGLADVIEAAGELGLRGSAGAGVAYVAMPADQDLTEIQARLTRLREAALRHGGSAVVLDAPTSVKPQLDLWGPVPGLELMRRVKDEFDPDHRLSPGRFVGGI